MRDNNLENHERGKWLILKYLPVSLFSLRMTHATSKGGKTLLIPTPYAFKMTLIDACFRVFNCTEAETKARQVFDIIKNCEIRFSPPADCIVQNTFIKIKQEDRDAPKGLFNSTIAYREFCFYTRGELKVAIRANFPENDINLLKKLGIHINCIGKRGSFWQYIDNEIFVGDLSEEYTCTSEEQAGIGDFKWSQYLDDFGEALCKAKDGFDCISTYGKGDVKLGEQRILVKTVLPYRFKQSSKHFSQYEK